MKAGAETPATARLPFVQVAALAEHRSMKAGAETPATEKFPRQ